MKSFEGQTYYEILKITPDADLNAIKHAYREALNTYEDDSLVTYSLFSDEQRAGLLQAIDEAFHTLSDAGKRGAYDQMLVNSGRIDAAALSKRAPDATRPSSPQGTAPIKHRDLRAWVSNKSQEGDIRQMIAAINGKDLISGDDLKRLRLALGVDLAEIFQITRVTTSILKMIEGNQFEALPADVFLKSFLKAYAQILQIDPQRVVEGFLKYRTLADKR